MNVVGNLMWLLKWCEFLALFPRYDSKKFKANRYYCALVCCVVSSFQIYSVTSAVTSRIEAKGQIVDLHFASQITWGLFLFVSVGTTGFWNTDKVNSFFVHLTRIDLELKTTHGIDIGYAAGVKLKFATVNILFTTLLGVILAYDVHPFFLLEASTIRLDALAVATVHSICAKSLSSLYWSAFEVTHIYNQLFGWRTFLHVICIFTEMLNLVSNCTPTQLVYNVSLVVQLLFLVRKSEQVKQAFDVLSRKTSELLHKYTHEDRKFSIACSLTQQVQQKQPKIAAAGFFYVDHSSLFTFVNLFAAYVTMLHSK